MTQQTRNILIGIIAIIVIVTLGYFAWHERKTSLPPVGTTSTATSTASSSISGVISSSTASGQGYTITPIYANSTNTAPGYKTPLSTAGLTADEISADQSQFATIQTTLASNPTDWSSWIQLGILRKETGDYAGAAVDWTYITEIYPSDPTAFADLGDLYANYLNQPSKGITEYKQAIKLDPTKEESFYENLAQIYIKQGDTTDARAILQQGITAQVVGYQNLQNLLNSMAQ